MTLHAAKGLEFPVVYMLACEQGILPHERSLSRDAELEEERRLASVGMTRAQEELYFTHCRLREFRGQTLYAVPSMFLDELPTAGVDHMDLSASAGGTQRAMETWRGATSGASSGWYDTGFARPSAKPQESAGVTGPSYAVGVLVVHGAYGVGKVTDIGGHRGPRKGKGRFSH